MKRNPKAARTTPSRAYTEAVTRQKLPEFIYTVAIIRRPRKRPHAEVLRLRVLDVSMLDDLTEQAVSRLYVSFEPEREIDARHVHLPFGMLRRVAAHRIAAHGLGWTPEAAIDAARATARRDLNDTRREHRDIERALRDAQARVAMLRTVRHPK